MDAWSGARAVVTGAAGFLGGHLVPHLAGEGAVVTGIDRRSTPAAGAGHLEVDLGLGDADPAVRAALEHADVVFHLAGASRSGSGEPGSDHRDDAGAAAAVLGLTPPDVPLVVVTSDEVYGGACRAGGRIRPSHEHDPLLPRSAAARSKALVERVCGRRRATGGLVTVVRPFTVLGPGGGGPAVLDEWAWAASHGVPIPLVGAIDHRRDVVDVRQVAPALSAIAGRPGTDVVNLGTGQPLRLGELLDAVGRAVGRPVAVEAGPGSLDIPADTCADTERLAALIGRVPVTDPDDLVRARLGAGADLHSRVVSANMA
jgi:nucleoside-diphosphate-sugar epimerase